MNKIIEAIQNLGGKCRFVSVTYTSKKHQETARYTILLNASYLEQLRASITECSIQLQDETLDDLAKMALIEMKMAYEKSLHFQSQGQENPDYTKEGMYTWIGNGIKVFKDATLELQGLQHAKKVLIPGNYKPVKHRNKLTAKKAELRKTMPLSRLKTLSLDLETIHGVRVEGETLVLE
jgi:hypothetical protein